MYVLWDWAFGIGTYFGISFLVAATLSILKGHVFTHPLRMILVTVAVVIGSLIIPGIGVDAWQALRGGDTVTAICFVGIIVLLWLLKGRLESGRARANWVGGPRRSRRLDADHCTQSRAVTSLLTRNWEHVFRHEYFVAV